MRSHREFCPGDFCESALVRKWIFQSLEMKLNLIQFQGHGMTNDDESSLIAMDLSS